MKTNILYIIICLIFILTGCTQPNLLIQENEVKNNELQNNEKVSEYEKDSNIIKDYNLEITFINVGQGDAIYLESNNQNMLVDTGSSHNEIYLLEFLEDKNIEKIDYLVCTHMHEDHIGNADEVLEKYKVENIYLSKIEADTKAFNNLKLAVDLELSSNILYPEEGHTFYLGTSEITVLSAERINNLNNSSIVLLIKNKEDYILLTGDAEKEIEKKLVKEYYNILSEVDVLKVGHHGSYNSSCEEFISTITPSYSVISYGENNSYRHPHSETIEILEKYESEIFLTTEGNITFYSNGNSFD